MPRPVLTRFETALYTDKSATDSTQVPFAFAQVELYAQGATASASVTVLKNNGEADVTVYDPGDLANGGTVQVGVGGPSLEVVSVQATPAFPGSTTIRLRNTSPSQDVAVSQGTRLILTSNRPFAYADPLGTISLGSSVTADASGRLNVYLKQRRFDYVVVGSGGAVVFDASSSGNVEGGGVLTWNHTASGAYRCVLVGVAFTGDTGTETIQTVTYGGQPMTLVASTDFTAMYRLANPPTGSQPVVVTFNPGAQVAAVGGAVSASGVNLGVVLTPQTAKGTAPASQPNISVVGLGPNGLIVDTLGIGNLPPTSNATAAAGVGQTSRWNLPAVSLFKVRGAGSTKPTGGTSTSMSWTISPSTPNKMWGFIAAEMKPLVAVSRLFVDAMAGTVPSPAWLDARNYASIQAVVDALPAAGGKIYLPAGTWTITTPITLPPGKPVHLLGDGIDRTIIKCSDVMKDMLLVQASYSTIEDLSLEGPHIEGSPPLPGDGRGLVIGHFDEGLQHVAVIGCRIRNTASWCLYVMGQDDQDTQGQTSTNTLTLWGHYERCDFCENQSRGGVYIGPGNTTQYFQDCSVTRFRSYGLLGLSVAGLTLRDCTLEENFDTSEDDTRPYLALGGCTSASVDHCAFEQGGIQPAAANLGDRYFIAIAPGRDPHDPPTPPAPPAPPAINYSLLDQPCFNVTINTCAFIRPNQALKTRPKMISVERGSRAIHVLAPHCTLQQRRTDKSDILIMNSDPANDVTVVGGVVFGPPPLPPPPTPPPDPPAPPGPSAVLIDNGGPAGADDPQQTAVIGNAPRLNLPRLNNLQRGQLPAREGDLIFNQQNGRVEMRKDSAWIAVTNINDESIASDADIDGTKLSSSPAKQIPEAKLGTGAVSARVLAAASVVNASIASSADIDGHKLSTVLAKAVPFSRLKASLYIRTFHSPDVIGPGATQGYEISTFSGAPQGINFDTAKPLAMFIYDSNLSPGANPASGKPGKLIPYVSISRESGSNKWYFMMYNRDSVAMDMDGLNAEIIMLDTDYP